MPIEAEYEFADQADVLKPRFNRRPVLSVVADSDTERRRRMAQHQRGEYVTREILPAVDCEIG